MCERCANIDYPIGDSIWLPCGGSSDRYRARSRKRSYGEEDFEALRIIQELRDTNRRLQQLIVAQREELKALRLTPTRTVAHAWEGPETP